MSNRSNRSFDGFEQLLLDSAKSDGMSSERKLALVASFAGGAAFSTTTAAAAHAAAVTKAKAGIFAVAAKWVLPVIAMGAVVGTVVGAGIHLARPRAPSAAATSPVQQTPVQQTPIVQLSDLPSASDTAPVDEPVVAAPKPQATSMTRASASPPTLADELRLIERARSALAANDVAAADQALAVHARTFPSGVFAEEAHVLRIDSMMRRGDRARATRAASAYLATHPESPYAPRLHALLGDPER